jgi:hypothetical protein
MPPMVTRCVIPSASRVLTTATWPPPDLVGSHELFRAPSRRQDESAKHPESIMIAIWVLPDQPFETVLYADDFEPSLMASMVAAEIPS